MKASFQFICINIGSAKIRNNTVDSKVLQTMSNCKICVCVYARECMCGGG